MGSSPTTRTAPISNENIRMSQASKRYGTRTIAVPGTRIVKSTVLIATNTLRDRSWLHLFLRSHVLFPQCLFVAMMSVLHGAHVLLALVMERAPFLLVFVLQLTHLVSQLFVHFLSALLALLNRERRAGRQDQRRCQHKAAHPYRLYYASHGISFPVGHGD